MCLLVLMKLSELLMLLVGDIGYGRFGLSVIVVLMPVYLQGMHVYIHVYIDSDVYIVVHLSLVYCKGVNCGNLMSVTRGPLC